MNTTTFARIAIAIIAVGLFIVAITLAQGVGEAFGHGIREVP